MKFKYLVFALASLCYQPAFAQNSFNEPEVQYSSPTSTFEIVNSIAKESLKLLSKDENLIDLTNLQVFKLGDYHPDIASLREALINKGFYTSPLTTEVDLHVFDQDVYNAVLIAQKQFGVKEDGVAGPILYEKLSASERNLGEQLNQYSVFLDNQLQTARLEGKAKAVVVNVPSYQLIGVDLLTGKTEVESRVIVGMSGKTPIFTTNIVNLKYNPDWSPPPSLLAKGKRYVPAGPNNPLGKIRFSTDNNIFIYLHHTNEPNLFERPTRALSSGCVRVEQWDVLASFVSGQPLEHIHEKVANKKTTFEKVEPVPVFINYSTVDVVDGVPMKFSDVYRREK